MEAISKLGMGTNQLSHGIHDSEDDRHRPGQGTLLYSSHSAASPSAPYANKSTMGDLVRFGPEYGAYPGPNFVFCLPLATVLRAGGRSRGPHLTRRGYFHGLDPDKFRAIRGADQTHRISNQVSWPSPLWRHAERQTDGTTSKQASRREGKAEEGDG
ncbi:hypothetical protein H104_02111 [Trichophyton rubrum CBS 289.86]|nr:hypothetical protein H104_02111 [Trichophyton rubrum CBS 289.86]